MGCEGRVKQGKGRAWHGAHVVTSERATFQNHNMVFTTHNMGLAVYFSSPAILIIINQEMPVQLVPTLSGQVLFTCVSFSVQSPGCHIFPQRSSLEPRGNGLTSPLRIRGGLSSEVKDSPQVSHLGRRPSDHLERKLLTLCWASLSTAKA